MSSLCCDICFEQFTGGGTSKPMIICANGHSVCQQCSKNMKLCPQCRFLLHKLYKFAWNLQNKKMEAKIECLNFLDPLAWRDQYQTSHY